MRNFEKKLSLKLKGEIERIVPEYRQFDIEIKRETEEEYRSSPVIRRRRGLFQKRMLASFAAMIILIVSIFGIDYLFGGKGESHSFQIIAFAGSESMDKSQLEERFLEADISLVMPNGQITLDPDSDSSNGLNYGWGTGSFYVAGKDIVRVTYSLKNGLIQHYDQAMEYKQNLEGNPVQIEFFLPYSALNLDESKISIYQIEQEYTERFKELWKSEESPELEAVKKGYFAGKSTDLEDYTIMNFVGTWDAAQTNGRYFRLRDIALDDQLNKEAHKVTVEYYHYDYGKDFDFDDSIYSVMWSPDFSLYPTAGITTPEDLPGDEMTITVELKNGETIQKHISLSFDKEGYVVARIK